MRLWRSAICSSARPAHSCSLHAQGRALVLSAAGRGSRFLVEVTGIPLRSTTGSCYSGDQMTAVHHYTLHCDHKFVDPGGNVYDSCSQCFVGGPRADATRAVAAESGWVHFVAPGAGPSYGIFRFGDLCQAHREDIPRGGRVLPMAVTSPAAEPPE